MVAAITLGTIVATPASADTVTLAVTTSVAGSGTALAPFTVNVPFDNVVTDTTTGTTTEALTFTATVTSGTPVTFTVSGNAKIVTALNATVNSTSGANSITVTPASTTAVVYVFTTSTSASAVTASVLGAATTVYLKGIAGPAYNVSLSVPSSGNVAGTVTATSKVTDIFGNAVATAPTFTAINATAGAAIADPLVVGTYTSTITLPATAGNSAVGVSIVAPTPVPTLAVAKTADSSIVVSLDLAAALAAEKAARAADKVAADKVLADALAKAAADKATAEKTFADTLAAEKANSAKALSDALTAHAAELAKVKADNDAALAAIKKAFNALAAKWNAKNPKSKVATLK